MALVVVLLSCGVLLAAHAVAHGLARHLCARATRARDDAASVYARSRRLQAGGGERDGQVRRFDVQLRAGRMGVTMIQDRRPAPLGLALEQAALAPLRVLQDAASRALVKPEATLRGPIGIVAASPSNDTARDRVAPVLFLLGTYGAQAWPLTILVAFLINRPRGGLAH